MLKRLTDVVVSLVALIVSSPIMIPVLYLIYRQDRHSPFYVADRVGRGGKPFRMVKLRSMIKNADKSGVDSTSASDNRITPIGRFVRKTKLDEVPQFWNVLRGEMSLVGPRPNVERETRMYTEQERELLSVRPGITDLSSIVFSDEGDILEGQSDPDLAYNQLIRPWKSRLGIHYIRSRNLLIDFVILGLTFLAPFSRPVALRGVTLILKLTGSGEGLIEVASRSRQLTPAAPPGATEIVTARY